MFIFRRWCRRTEVCAEQMRVAVSSAAVYFRVRGNLHFFLFLGLGVVPPH